MQGHPERADSALARNTLCYCAPEVCQMDTAAHAASQMGGLLDGFSAKASPTCRREAASDELRVGTPKSSLACRNSATLCRKNGGVVVAI